MLTIVQWENMNPQPLTSGVVETFARENPVLELMPYANVAGSAYKYNQEATLPGVAFRGIGDSYTESTGTISPVTEPLVILGGDSDFDVAHIKMQTGDNDTRGAHDTMKAKAIALSHLKTFFDGDNSVGGQENEFDGLNVRLTGGQVITAGANGAQLTLDMLDQLVDAVIGTPSVILLNKAARRKIRALARNSTTLSISRDQFGREVDAYQGVPLRVVEEDSSGAQILGFDETQGSSNVACSIYAVKFALDGLHGIQTEPVNVRDLGELQSGPVAYRTRIEWYNGIVNKAGKAAARLKGVLAG